MSIGMVEQMHAYMHFLSALPLDEILFLQEAGAASAVILFICICM
jgi:hypothetical protein